uniref:Uncharacterized protein n=1 Tax=Oryza barthii TaxID=65489 RepID=A0A0D3F659_9ORYZ
MAHSEPRRATGASSGFSRDAVSSHCDLHNKATTSVAPVAPSGHMFLSLVLATAPSSLPSMWTEAAKLGRMTPPIIKTGANGLPWQYCGRFRMAWHLDLVSNADSALPAHFFVDRNPRPVSCELGDEEGDGLGGARGVWAEVERDGGFGRPQLEQHKLYFILWGSDLFFPTSMLGSMDVLNTLPVRFHFNGDFVVSGREKLYVGGSEAMSYLERDKAPMEQLQMVKVNAKAKVATQ